MRDIEKGIFMDLGQLELIENDCSAKAIQKGKKVLNKFLYEKMRKQCEDFDVYGMIELQKQPIYKNALRQVVAAYDIEEQLVNAAKGWDFAVINTSVFDSLFTDKDNKRKCAEEVLRYISSGNFDTAENVLIQYIKKARVRTVEQCYNFIDVSAEKVEVNLSHGLVAKDESIGAIKVYDENEEAWIYPVEYYKRYNIVPEKLIEMGVTEEVIKKMISDTEGMVNNG